MIKIAIYEDNKRYRESLALFLSSNGTFSLVGSYQNANNIINELNESQADVILMDIQMPGLNGINAVRKIREINSETFIIILTVFETNELVFDALSAGANGYILKNTPTEKITASIDEVVAGGAPMSSTIAKKVLSFFNNKTTKITDEYHLTLREKEVLNLLVKGFTYKMIAAECIISMDTVRSHIKKIYEKLQVNSNIEAVNKAINKKLV
jgi:DNA-binding NarL/FixJ family response regulator